MSLNPWLTCHKKAVQKIDECVEAIPKVMMMMLYPRLNVTKRIF